MLTLDLPNARSALRCLLRWLAALLLALPCALPLRAQDAVVTESDLKAAFLYNAVKFIDWPGETFDHAESPIAVGIFGEEEFVATLRTLLHGKKAHGRNFTVRKVANAQEARECQILFFSSSETRRLQNIGDQIRRLPILTIGESNEFLDEGGILNIFFEDKQLRFEVNSAAAEGAKLSISSQLMKLAKKVRKGGK